MGEDQLIRTYSNSIAGVEINLWFDGTQYIVEFKEKGNVEKAFFSNKRDASKSFAWKVRRVEAQVGKAVQNAQSSNK